jgi:hypothetical protein
LLRAAYFGVGWILASSFVFNGMKEDESLSRDLHRACHTQPGFVLIY